jgi:4-amino-4-deoxy-L-arabinose transferase-like glycosyltransferase
MTNSQEAPPHLTTGFLLLLGAYFALHIVLRVLVSDSLDYDEAEQALLGQWLLVGYTEQPPLYTWMQYALFQIFGKNVFAVSLLKNALLFLTYAFVFLSGREIFKDSRAAILATCSLLLIPQIGWESQRDMTHTTLVVCAAAASLWQALRLMHKQGLVNYVFFGVLLSIGILGKANFALFIATLLLTMTTCPTGRKVLFSSKILLTLAIIAVLTGPYLLWMFNNQDIVFSASYKFKRVVEGYQVQGVISLFLKSFLFLTPLWLVYLLIFPAGFARNALPETEEQRRFIKRYLLTLFFILLVIVFFFKVTYVKDRWLQPLLFAAPLFFFARLAPVQITPKRFKIFLGVVCITAVAVYCAFAIRVVGASVTGRFCRMNYPFTAIAKELRLSGFSHGLIISDNRFIAGNMHMRFPDSTALIPGYNFAGRSRHGDFSSAAVIWQADTSSSMPPELASFLNRTYNVDIAKHQVKYLHNRYKYSRTETVKFAVVQFPLPATPATGSQVPLHH